MSTIDAQEAIYKLSEQMSAELANARREYYDNIDAIYARYKPMLDYCTDQLPADEPTVTEFSKRLKKQRKQSAA